MSRPSAQDNARAGARPADPPPVHPFLRIRSPAVRAAAGLFAKAVFRTGVRFSEGIGRYEHLHRRLLKLPNFGKWPGPGFTTYEPTARDVVVVTYSKSGTNLALQTLHQIARRGAGEFRHIHDEVPWPEGLAVGTATLADDPGEGAFRAIKTHLPIEQVPFPEEPGPARWVYVARDPAEVFVSAYHFIRGLAFGPAMPTVENWLGTWLRGEFNFGSWAEHVAPWWDRRDRPDVLFLTYREWTADPPATVVRLERFTDVPLTEAERADVLRLSSREWMKAHDERFRPGVSTPWADAAAPILRRGRSGASGELLSADQQRRLREHSRAELRRLGCDLPFDRLFPASRPAGGAGPAEPGPAKQARRGEPVAGGSPG